MNRRSLLMLLVNAGTATSAAVVAIPAMVNALSPVLERRGGEDWRAAGALKDFPLREVHQAVIAASKDNWPPAFEPLAVFVWRASESEVVVYSRSCTDLRCPLNYDTRSSCFFCPCHGGIFATNGERMAGPPSRPMYRYAVRVRDGMVEIDVNSLPPMG